MQAKQTAVEELEKAKSVSEAEAAELKATVDKLQADDNTTALTALQEQVCSPLNSATHM